jgi:hypothetical protein
MIVGPIDEDPVDPGRSPSIGVVLDLARDEVDRLCRRFSVARLAVFGSAVTDEFDPERGDRVRSRAG